MIFIWGWRTRRKAIGEGTFFSPATGKDGPYRLVEVRRWFTVFFLPVIPLKVIGQWVECGVTKKLYDPAVLNNPTSAQLLEQLSAGARDLVAAVASADGPVTAARREVAIDVVGARIEGYDKDALRADIGRVTSGDVSEHLQLLAGSLTEQGREKLLADACSVLVADGEPGANGRALVEQAGRDLGMSAAHVRGVIDTAVSAHLS